MLLKFPPTDLESFARVQSAIQASVRYFDALERTAKLQRCSMISLVADQEWVSLVGVGDSGVGGGGVGDAHSGDDAAALAAAHAVETRQPQHQQHHHQLGEAQALDGGAYKLASPRSTLSKFMPTEYRKVGGWGYCSNMLPMCY